MDDATQVRGAERIRGVGPHRAGPDHVALRRHRRAGAAAVPARVLQPVGAPPDLRLRLPPADEYARRPRPAGPAPARAPNGPQLRAGGSEPGWAGSGWGGWMLQTQNRAAESEEPA
jgi:hypothetical protein